jgi:hypothetical protein
VDWLPIMLACYVVPLSLLGGPIAWKWRRRAAWQSADAVIPLVPFLVWLAVSTIVPSQKSMSNMVAEPVLLAVLVVLTVCLRAVATPWLGSRTAAALWLATVIAAGWLVWFAVPLMNE